jgi:hypothetical protein
VTVWQATTLRTSFCSQTPVRSAQEIAANEDVRLYVKTQLTRVIALDNLDYGVEGALAIPDARNRAEP